jgi:hypothetical protein
VLQQTTVHLLRAQVLAKNHQRPFTKRRYAV